MSAVNSISVGSDLGAICRKCGDVWQVGDQVSKVQCQRCGGYHRYTAPPGERPAAPPKPKAAGGRRRRVKAPAPEPIASRIDAPARPYRVSETYARGDAIEHPKFGLGLVEGPAGPGKIRVRFDDGERTLIEGR